MAKEKLKPLLELPENVRKDLENEAGNIEKAEKALESLKKMGLDTTALEEKLEWAKEVKDTILKDFG